MMRLYFSNVSHYDVDLLETIYDSDYFIIIARDEESYGKDIKQVIKNGSYDTAFDSYTIFINDDMGY